MYILQRYSGIKLMDCIATHLAHELLDHAVEGRALVAEALLASAESAEVLCLV